MKRKIVIHLAAAIWACAAALPAHAHHSHPLFYDQCKRVTIEGRIESVQKNPHVWVVLKLDDGTTYNADWISLQGLTNQGVAASGQAALSVGAHVVVTGNPLRDPDQVRASFPGVNANLDPKTVDVISIRRMDNSWNWAQTVPECKSP